MNGTALLWSASAAFAAGFAANVASDAAAYALRADRADATIKTKIIEYGIKLLKEEK